MEWLYPLIGVVLGAVIGHFFSVRALRVSLSVQKLQDLAKLYGEWLEYLEQLHNATVQTADYLTWDAASRTPDEIVGAKEYMDHRAAVFEAKNKLGRVAFVMHAIDDDAARCKTRNELIGSVAEQAIGGIQSAELLMGRPDEVREALAKRLAAIRALKQDAADHFTKLCDSGVFFYERAVQRTGFLGWLKG